MMWWTVEENIENADADVEESDGDIRQLSETSYNK